MMFWTSVTTDCSWASEVRSVENHFNTLAPHLSPCSPAGQGESLALSSARRPWRSRHSGDVSEYLQRPNSCAAYPPELSLADLKQWPGVSTSYSHRLISLFCPRSLAGQKFLFPKVSIKSLYERIYENSTCFFSNFSSSLRVPRQSLLSLVVFSFCFANSLACFSSMEVISGGTLPSDLPRLPSLRA